ncbi:hypothetical protein GOP47_0006508 [Adiantum capillus-veneris]|uniref:Uncharacterized protein n=1 Tax=Adiantum capillus-veneris TaxID=13818 RepID=A0A9D4V4J1_ADICA|nr:hypothetical protein GOP47_0006508 [Adiantum capillus-veneris]
MADDEDQHSEQVVAEWSKATYCLLWERRDQMTCSTRLKIHELSRDQLNDYASLRSEVTMLTRTLKDAGAL